jgi:DNA mismatch repair protein MutS2
MDAKSLEKLELPKVLQRLAAYAAFSGSKDAALELQPTTSLAQARRRQAEVTQARSLLISRSDLTIGGAHDVRPQAEAAAHGAVLEPKDLLDLKNTLVAARSMTRLFEKVGGSYPALSLLAGGLQPLPGLIDLISQVVTERGEVPDSASPALAAIRRDLRVAHDRLMAKLQRMLSDPKIAPMLQEGIVTQRDGRFVLPLRAEFKGRIRAVIHDQSASGATFFIEPITIVDLNNEVRELELTERDEIRRILTEVSATIGEQAEEVRQTVEALAELDLAFARARYAEALDACEPILLDVDHPPPEAGRLRLLAARHPLLDPTQVVPIDMVLDPGTTALVITGPNTGGKTVALKTAALLSLMAQCGLHLPAASGSEVTVFEGVYADIGDEQSIEQSLSTFSSHVANIVQILRVADQRSLVILDELGAGTDPAEGSALARAILREMLSRGATTLVATHYPELKAFAHSTPGVRNASVEFDLSTLRPTYHLVIGLPGRSNALAIAERLGLLPTVIEGARQLLSPEDLEAESMLDEIHRQRAAVRAARGAAEQSAAEAEAIRTELERRLAGIEDERDRLLRSARQEGERELEAVREELDSLRRQLAAARQPLDAVREIEAALDQVEAEVIAAPEPEPIPMARLRRLRPGDRVRVRTLQAEGVVQEVEAEQAEVQIGRLRVRARLEELELPSGAAEPAPPIRRETGRRGAGAVQLPPVPPLEIDLRGLAADESLEELDRRLDAACLAGVPFLRIIHGKGTGKLRQAVRQALRDNPYVTSFEPGTDGEGGDGVTVARLAVR